MARCDCCNSKDECDCQCEVSCNYWDNINKIEALEEKIESLFKIIDDKDRTADVLFSDNTALEAKVEKLKVGLEQIGKYETCWTCKYYIGSTDKYCNPVGHCDVNRSQFVPNEKSKLLALETLKEVFGE